MSFKYDRADDHRSRKNETSTSATPGKTTLTERLSGAPQRAVLGGTASQAAPVAAPYTGPDPFAVQLQRAVQRLEREVASGADVPAAAARGVATPTTAMPHAAAIQTSFGSSFDVSRIQAHVGGAAVEACGDMGARAFATGDHVAFADAPDLHTAAHEAAHAAQQARGVSLSGGVGAAGDAYEQHADQIADLVVQGRSAAHLLAGGAGGAMASRGAVQQLISTDGLDEKVGVVKKINAYNASLLKLLDTPNHIPAAVAKLEGMLKTIQSLLFGAVRGLSEERRVALRALVGDELRELSRVRDAPRLLPALRAVKSSLPVQHDNLQIGGNEGPNLDEGNDPGVLGEHGGEHQDVHGGEHQDVHGGEHQDVHVEGGALAGKLKEEDHTRIGFEIELGRTYTGEVAVFDAVKAVINQTLFEFVNQAGKIMLEMLLDDAQKSGRKCTFQVEFRTPPLELTAINQATYKEIRKAISAFNAPTAFDSQQSLSRGWRRTVRCQELIAEIGDGSLTTLGRFTAPTRLAQHVTSSINVDAYTRLDPDQQQALYKHGKGSKQKIDLYKLILSALDSGTINATTTGRNDGKHLVKSPIEAMLAAEEALMLEGSEGLTDELSREDRPNKVTNGDNHTYDIPNLRDSVGQIQHDGSFPEMQGQGDRVGYLAKAEKLQAPLLDPRNRQLRVLVEHRTDDLCIAVNDIMAGKHSTVWDQFVRAVREMDSRTG